MAYVGPILRLGCCAGARSVAAFRAPTYAKSNQGVVSPATVNNAASHPPAWLNGDLRGLDPGIRKAVERLQAARIETFESCEGGPGHSFPDPTVRFYGTPEAGWRALGICLAYGLPVLCLRRVWYVLDANEPTGPQWEITFRERC